jgi:hypothetical protein
MINAILSTVQPSDRHIAVSQAMGRDPRTLINMANEHLLGAIDALRHLHNDAVTASDGNAQVFRLYLDLLGGA